MEVRLTKELTFLKIFDDEGNLVSENATITKAGAQFHLVAGYRKQVINQKTVDRILAITGKPKEKAPVKDEPKEEVKSDKDNLSKKPKAELLKMAKELYTDGEVTSALSKEKLIELINNAKE